MKRKKVTLNLELVVPAHWEETLLLELIKSTLNVSFFRDGDTFRTGVEKVEVVKSEKLDD